MQFSIVDIEGVRFGRLVAISPVYQRRGKWYWACDCDCGNMTVVVGSDIKNGVTTSCGCVQKESMTRVGMGNSGKYAGLIKYPKRLYEIWDGMKKRCYDKNRKSYRWYGKRGIKICQDWLDNYLLFKEWAVMNGYERKLTIDRVDNDGNYHPDNCRFITRSENSRRKRKK
jgi:hypothetical protein